MQRIVIIGGGAAGFFAAIQAKTVCPAAEVVILEKSNKVLAKVRISGGGRCNVTHACFKPSVLATHYPRGQKFLKKSFQQFSTNDTIDWFESRGVQLKTEADNRMFPTTDNSQTIIDCLHKEAIDKLGVQLRYRCPVQAVRPTANGFELDTPDGLLTAQKVIVATGGQPKMEGFRWLSALGHTIQPPVPSLFTFNLPGDPIRELMGVVAPNVLVRLQGSKLRTQGPVLVTHWGLSGPAVLKLSALAAREFNAQDYHLQVQVNWVGYANEERFREDYALLLSGEGADGTPLLPRFGLPKRLWEYLAKSRDLDPKAALNSQQLNGKMRNRWVDTLLNDVYTVKGKTTFKEEFVTCGGVDLPQVDPNTLESRVCPGLYFSGEVLDIDGITGGFNFQAAWTTGFLAGRATGGSLSS